MTSGQADLAAIIAALRERLATGTLPEKLRDEAESLLWHVDFFTLADRWQENPEQWRPIRVRLAGRLRTIGERLRA